MASISRPTQSLPRFSGSASRVPQTIVPPAASRRPLLTGPHPSHLCRPGLRSKAAAAQWAGLPGRASPVRTARVATMVSPIHRSTRSSAMAHTGRPNAARPELSGRGHHLQRPTSYPVVSAQDRIPAAWRGADGPGTRLSIAAAAHLFGYRHATITRWLARAGEHSAPLHDRVFCNLHLPHIQLAELRTRLRRPASTLWLSLAVEELSKLRAVLHHPEGTGRAHAGSSPCRDPRPAPTAGP
jgi:hypothetical protein